MNRLLPFFAISIATLAACSTTESGVRDPSRFREIAERSVIASALPETELVACFRDTADFLPSTEFLPPRNDAGTDYRLRGFGFTFEEIEFRPAPGGGSTATLLLAPGVNQKWRRDFQRDRVEPLRACASGEA